MADVSVQKERINGWIPSSATHVILNWPERIKTQPHDDRDNCFQHFDSKGPCGMTVNNDIDDDSATKHSDSHNLGHRTHELGRPLAQESPGANTQELTGKAKSTHRRTKQTLTTITRKSPGECWESLGGVLGEGGRRHRGVPKSPTEHTNPKIPGHATSCNFVVADTSGE